MARFIARQPNGLLCRYSTIVDTVVAYNMTDEEYLSEYDDREEGLNILINRIRPFEEVLILLNNETVESRYELYKEMGCTDEEINELIEDPDDCAEEENHEHMITFKISGKNLKWRGL